MAQAARRARIITLWPFPSLSVTFSSQRFYHSCALLSLMELRTHPQSSQMGSHLYTQNQRSSPIDLTLDDEPQLRPAQLKRPRMDFEVDDFPPRSSTSSPSTSYASSSSPSLMAPSIPTPLSSLSRPTLNSHLHVPHERPNYINSSQSSSFAPPNANSQSLPSLFGNTIPHTNGSGLQQMNPTHLNGFQGLPPLSTRPPSSNQIIDLTTSPSPPPMPNISQHAMNTSGPNFNPPQPPQPSQGLRPGMLPMPPKTPVCIGQLQATALILYPISYLQAQGTNDYRFDPEWASVRLKYDAELKRTNPNAEETIHIKTPGGRNAAGEVTEGETFGVVEQRIATYLGPLMGRGLIRLDAKVRVGAPNVRFPTVTSLSSRLLI